MSKNLTDNLPLVFKENVVGICGERGREWLKDLPETINEIAENWSLAVGSPFQNLSYNYVAPCGGADGRQAVLKIGLPKINSVFFNEPNYLKAFNGNGMVKLLRFDESARAMLLERLIPGENRRAIAARRIEIFAEAFTVEPRDLQKWAFAEAVLSAWWTLEDGGSSWEKWLACADMWKV